MLNKNRENSVLDIKNIKNGRKPNKNNEFEDYYS